MLVVREVDVFVIIVLSASRCHFLLLFTAAVIVAVVASSPPPGPVLVLGVVLHVLRPQSLSLVDERTLFPLSQQLPFSPWNFKKSNRKYHLRFFDSYNVDNVGNRIYPLAHGTYL